MTERSVCCPEDVSLGTGQDSCRRRIATSATLNRRFAFPWRVLKLLVVICSSMVCLLGLAQAAVGENLLVNGNFDDWTEGALDHWGFARSLAVTRSRQGQGRLEPGLPPLGYAAIVEKAPREDGLFYQYADAPLKVGQAVRFSVWLKLHEDCPDDLPGEAIKIHITNDSDAAAGRNKPGDGTIMNLDEVRIVRPVKKQYVKFEVTQVIREGAKSIAASIRLATDVPIKLYVDEAVLQFVGEARAPGPFLAKHELPTFKRPSLTSITLPTYKEDRYEAVVPDTVDLAERAALAINGLTRIVDPNCYETYQCANFNVKPAYMNHMYGGPCLQKPVEALPMMRVMSGSGQNQDVDRKMLEAITREIEADGLWWLRLEGRPWRKPFEQDFVFMTPHGRLMSALMTWHDYTRDPSLLETVQKMSDGVAEIALYTPDYAYLVGEKYFRSGWPHKNEPSPFCIGIVVRGLSHWAALSGDQRALDLAGRLSRFMAQPQRWGTPADSPNIASGEKGHWARHFHLATFNVMGVLEYAIAANDAQLKRWVKGFYEYGRDFGISRIGFFPSIASAKKDKDRVAEPCNLADMIWLAVHLSDAGIGDYWDDVDQYVRNCLIEYQFTDPEILEAISAVGPDHEIKDPRIQTDDDVIARNIGTFTSGSDPTISMALWTMCCVGNCSSSLYYAWESIVRCEDDVAQVNLLMNRASPWLDIDSHLPYEGKVVLKNKTAKRMHVRIPMWVDKQAVQCQVNRQSIPVVWLNRYVIVDGLKEKDKVTITFPMVETTERHTAPTYGITYTCQFKGNTLVDISPRAERPAWTECGQDDGVTLPVIKGYPMWVRRDRYKADKAPTKIKQRYVSPIIIRQ